MKSGLMVVITLLVALFMSASSSAFDVPVLHGRVNDVANLMTLDVRGQIEHDLKSLEEKTTAQVAILTVSDLQGQNIKSFSLKVAETWKLGQKEKDNGLLIFYTVKEDRYRIEVGRGLEGAIPDGLAGTIIREKLRKYADPKKGTRDFDRAFTEGVKSISKIILDEYARDPSGANMRKKAGNDDIHFWIIVVVFAGVTLIAGCIHEILGGLVGAFAGGGVAALFSFSIVGFIALVAIGLIFGLIAKFIVEAMLSGGDGGGGYSSGSSGSWSSSSSDSFSGSGGTFSGGGADG